MYHYLICFSLFFSSLSALSVNLPPDISLRVPVESAVEGQEITLYITVVHDPAKQIEKDSFMLEEEPLQVEAIRKERVAPEKLFKGEEGLIVDRFRATLAPLSAGIHSIGPVSVRVGDVRYRSGAISVHVQKAVSTEDLRLEAVVKGPKKIFPGQEVLFEYRIFFSEPMQIFKEELPLLTAKGFFPVGSVEVLEELSGGVNVQVIRQRARAEAPVRMTIERSLIEGMRVRGEKKRTIPPLMRAEAPPITVEVLPFPDEGRPPHFTGALGSFTWRVSSLDGSEVAVGQKVRIEYRVSGRGSLSTVQFPALDTLSGLQASFSTEGLAPTGEIDDGTKRFVLEVRPRKEGETVRVPGFLFASFDPVSERYLKATIPPVVLSVSHAEVTEQEEASSSDLLAPAFDLDTVQDQRFSSVWILVALIVSIIIAAVEYVYHRKRQERVERPATSRELFYQAMMRRSKKKESLHLLKKALYLRLFELKCTTTLVETPESIKEEGILADVKGLLQHIDRELYQQERGNLQEILDEASVLYHRLQQLEEIR